LTLAWGQWLTNTIAERAELLEILVRVRPAIDIALVLAIGYLLLVVIADRRTQWMVRGLAIVVALNAIARQFHLLVLASVLHYFALSGAVAVALTLQSEFRRFLEQLGRGEFVALFDTSRNRPDGSDSTVDEIVEAIKELSQNRTGALLILETNRPIDERDFSVPGVKLNAEVSKELLQTLFQTSTLLHDGAVLIRASRIVSAGVILPLSDRKASRQLGTRHRAAMGITERVKHCLCVVVSEETGSISLAERGSLNRPLTSSKLRELLDDRFSQKVDGEVVPSNLRSLGRQIGSKGRSLLSRWFGQ